MALELRSGGEERCSRRAEGPHRAVYQEETYWAQGLYGEGDDQKGFEHV